MGDGQRCAQCDSAAERCATGDVEEEAGKEEGKGEDREERAVSRTKVWLYIALMRVNMFSTLICAKTCVSAWSACGGVVYSDSRTRRRVSAPAPVGSVRVLVLVLVLQTERQLRSRGRQLAALEAWKQDSGVVRSIAVSEREMVGGRWKKVAKPESRLWMYVNVLGWGLLGRLG